MLLFEILEDDNIVVIELKGPLTEDDFLQLTTEVDLHLIRTENLKGLLIHAKTFPGWESLGGLISHLRFIRDHQKAIDKVALVSDSKLATVTPKIVDHFTRAEVKCFRYAEYDAALKWLRVVL